jgi:hypothetical protein
MNSPGLSSYDRPSMERMQRLKKGPLVAEQGDEGLAPVAQCYALAA